MAREIRVSPDGNAVAIRSTRDDPDAWVCTHYRNAGFWAPHAEVADWEVLVAGDE